MANPISEVVVCGRVPVDRQGEHVLWFGRKENETFHQACVRRAEYMIEHYGYFRQDAYQFQRLNKGIVEFDISMPRIDKANYIMVRNTYSEGAGSEPGGTPQWFYGFIDKVEYVNNSNARIYYTLDPLMCWQEEIYFGQCFIERSHIPKSEDKRFANLTPDSVPFGDYVYQDVTTDNTFITPTYQKEPYNNPENPDAETALINGWRFVIARVDTAVHPYNYMGSPIRLDVFRTFVELNDEIAKINKDGKTAEIVAMYMIPERFLTANEDFVGGFGERIYSKEGSYAMPDDFEGYVPKNNKLYSYPYWFMTVTNNAGNYLKYKLEDAGSSEFAYTIFANVLPGSKPVLVPKYPGDAYKNAFCLGLQLPPLPNIPVPTDSYAVWLAQNQGSNEVANLAAARSGITSIANMAVSAGAGAASAAGGNLAGAVSGIQTMVNSGADAYQSVKAAQARYADAQAMPDHVAGLSAPDTQYGAGFYHFNLMPTIIRRQAAEYIDNYWTRFGYPIMRIGTPNPRARPRFTYIKCSDPNVYSTTYNNTRFMKGFAQFVTDGWKSSLARGVTFWNPDKIYEGTSQPESTTEVVKIFNYDNN